MCVCLVLMNAVMCDSQLMLMSVPLTLTKVSECTEVCNNSRCVCSLIAGKRKVTGRKQTAARCLFT